MAYAEPHCSPLLWWPCTGFDNNGLARLPLFASSATGERVTMEWWAPGTRREFCPDALSGLELFVVSGQPLTSAPLSRHIAAL